MTAETQPQAKTPQPVRLADYRPPDWLVDQVELDFAWSRRNRGPGAPRDAAQSGGRRGRRPLVLDGQELELLELRQDGEALGANRYPVDGDHLSVHGLPDACTLESPVRIHPERNTALEGLYVSNGMFCTQCEPEGFRKITYFPDRPDVMARYRVRIEADRAACPVLLANGNLVEHGSLPAGRHFALWEDPFPKPSYLFALVAGRLAKLEDSFTTRSGRDVTLEIYAEPREIDKCDHAMASLKKAMRWDEERFGLEYDLDRFMIVAVSDFNMGAMENKGLNIFNTKYVLAKPETATDADYLGIESVIAHEYFHNWTGNRVTCRDWFQLSLKEGLTVFRDQEFTADLHSRAVKRIADVRRLRATQFLEDAGPLAHSGASRQLRRDQQLLHRHRVREGRRGHPHAAHADRRGGVPAGHAHLFRAPRRPGGDLRGLRRRDGGRVRPRSRPVPPLVQPGRHAAADRARRVRPARAHATRWSSRKRRRRPRASRTRRRCTSRSRSACSTRPGRELPLQLEGEAAPAGTRACWS